MQDGNDADLGSQVLGIRRDSQQGLRSSSEQQIYFFPVGDEVGTIVAEWISYLWDQKLSEKAIRCFPQPGFRSEENYNLKRRAWNEGIGPQQRHGRRFYCALLFSGLPIASKKMALFPFACGEKKAVTSSSKKVSPVEPRRWEYAAKYILPPMTPASSWTAR